MMARVIAYTFAIVTLCIMAYAALGVAVMLARAVLALLGITGMLP